MVVSPPPLLHSEREGTHHHHCRAAAAAVRELTPDLARAFVDADGSTWEPHDDEGSGGARDYDIHSATGEPSWEQQPAAAQHAEAHRDRGASEALAPVSAPDGSTWEPHYDEGSGAYYYIHSATGESSWEPPAAAHAEPHRNLDASDAPAPVSAPDGSTWEPHYDEGSGAYYYINSATGESSWLN